MTAQELRIVVYPCGDKYAARCLEHDIMATGRTMQQVKQAMVRVLAAHIELWAQDGKQPFEGVAPAPQHVHDRYNQLVAESSPHCDTLEVGSVRGNVAA